MIITKKQLLFFFALQTIMVIFTNAVYQHPNNLGGHLLRWDVFTLPVMYISSMYVASKYGMDSLKVLICLVTIPTFISTEMANNKDIDEIWLLDYIFNSNIETYISVHLAVVVTLTYVLTTLSSAYIYTKLVPAIQCLGTKVFLMILYTSTIDSIIFLSLIRYVVNDDRPFIFLLSRSIGTKTIVAFMIFMPIILIYELYKKQKRI